MDKTYHENKIDESDKIIYELDKQISKLGTLRVITFIIASISIVAGYELGKYVLYAIAVVLFTVFSGLVSKYNNIKNKMSYEVAKKEVIEDNIKRMSREWQNFSETGKEFDDEKLTRVKDLDLLGKGSIFQYICVANTPYGKRSLANALVKGYNPSQIKDRQEGVRELIENQKLSLHLKTLSKILGQDSKYMDLEMIDEFVETCEEKPPTINNLIVMLSFVLPVIAIGGILLIFTPFQTPLTTFIAVLSMVVQFGLGIMFSQSHNRYFDPAIKFCRNIEAYERFLYAIENQEFKSGYLKSLKQTIGYQGGPKKSIKELRKTANLIKLRYNGAANFILSSMLMWDFHSMQRYKKWNSQYGNAIRRWLGVMGEVEALLSLGVIGEVKDVYSYPEIKEANYPYVEFETLKHPLIKQEEAVENNLHIGAATCIITGSNMSGKTTFLRTIGINLALAYAGAPVLGSKFRAGYMEVMTSMRIADDVNEGISTFYAELLRIQNMIQYSKKKKPMIVLIDEIFRGTNSADRILGATETIHSLEKEWITIMVSTHDFELCELGENKNREAYNYHFTEYYEDDKIKFSYKMQQGRAQTTNAKFLLKMVGIIN